MPVPLRHIKPRSDPNSSQVLFHAFRDTAHPLDVIRLSDNLEATAPCTLFTDAAVGILPSNLAMTDATIDVSAVTVTVTDFSPEFANTSIALQSFTVADQPVCTMDPEEPIPVRVDWTVSGTPGQITLEFLSVPGFNYTIERTNRLEPGTASLSEPVECSVTGSVSGQGQQHGRRLRIEGSSSMSHSLA